MLNKQNTASSFDGLQSPEQAKSQNRRDRSKRGSVEFDFKNYEVINRGIEPLFNDTEGSFEHEMNLLENGALRQQRAFDLPLAKSPQTISPILKNKTNKKQHKFDVNALTQTKNHDLEEIAGLFRDDDGLEQ